MQRPLRALHLATLALLSAAVSLPARAEAATTYTITDLGFLDSAFPRSFAYQINGAGHAVGYSYPSNGFFQGFSWSQGHMTNLGHLANPANLTAANFSLAQGINAFDQIVGWSTFTVDDTGYEHAVLWQGGTITDLGTLPNFLSTSATAINDSRQIVGTASHAFAPPHTTPSGDRAFLWQNGVMTSLGTLGGGASAAYDINNAGQIVGNSLTTANAATHAFSWKDGVMTDLGALGAGTFSVAAAVNVSGHIVGASTFAAPGSFQDRHAFLYMNGHMTDLGVPAGAGTQSFAADINASDVIVGGAPGGETGGHPYVYRSGVWTNLNTLIPAGSGWVLNDASAINDAGQIVGSGKLNGVSRAYLLTPTAP